MIRQNRCLPRDLKQEEKIFKKGEMTFQKDGKTLFLSWVDKKRINMISTMHPADMTEVADKFGRIKMKLQCVSEYNAFIHGVYSAVQY
jgi:hypothetical protein